MKDWRRGLGILMVIAGLAMVGLYFMPGVQVWMNEQSVDIRNLSREEILANQKKDASKESFDASRVRNVTADDVAKAREAIKNGNAQLNVIGAVAMPKQGVEVSIMPGLSDPVLLSGAGTMFADQKLGVGNYPLASHNMHVVGPHLLLDDMKFNTHKGDPIYATDMNKIYEYKVFFAEVVPPTRVDLVDTSLTHDGHSIITLFECTDDSVDRYLVQGELVRTWDFDKAPKDIMKHFSEKA